LIGSSAVAASRWRARHCQAIAARAGFRIGSGVARDVRISDPLQVSGEPEVRVSGAG
jgi:hypothetical protein